MALDQKELFLIDATAFCYRAFYAVRGLATSFGQPTNAVFGFISMLNKLLKDYQPQFLAVCFDVSRDTFRQRKFAEYKINRPPMPEGLSSQIPLIKELISAYGITIFEKEGFEADDVIAALKRKARENNLRVSVVSADKDLLQLVDEHTRLLNPYSSEDAVYDVERVFHRFGVAPSAVADIIALMGDDIDNIPGIPGIGEKTAVGLLREFGSLDELIRNSGKVSQPKLREALTANLEQLKLNKELAQLDDRLELDFSLEALRRQAPDCEKLFRLFKRLEFKKFLRELPLAQGPAGAFEVLEIEDARLASFIAAGEELFLAGEDIQTMVFSSRGKFFRVNLPGESLTKVLADRQIKKSGYDLKKIKLALSRQGLSLEGLYFDLLLAAYLIDPARPDYSLSAIAGDYLDKLFPDSSLENITVVDLVCQLQPKLLRELENKTLLKLFREVEMPLVGVLAEMELSGIKLDVTRLKELSAELEQRLIKLIAEIYELSNCQFNLNSPKQLREVLFERLKLPVSKKGKTGPSTDEEVLRKLALKHKLPELLLEYRQLSKLKSTYIDTLPQMIDRQTGRLHASFNQAATETGRLSSSNPNLQNIPVKSDIGRKIRQAIMSWGPGHCLLACDYSQIELRILAHLAKDKALISAFESDKDIHCLTASLIYGLTEPEIDDAMRETAKRINFGIIYGLSAYGLGRDLGISVEEAQAFIDAYFNRYPEVRFYLQQQISRAEEDGFVTTILGRRRYLPQIKSKNQAIRQLAQRQAVNTPIQGSAADLIKLAMLGVARGLKEKCLKSAMIIQVHDELVFDVPQEELAELTVLVRERMEHALELSVPIKVSIKKGRNWLETEEV